MDYAKELNVALEAAAKASDYLRGAYAAFTPIPDAPASISTEADRTSQDLILAHLLAAFPDDALCAEEGTAALREAKRQGPRLWVVDPIDGTRGFAMKNGEFSVMIGLVVDGEIAVGVVLEPVLERVTYATRGGGCSMRIGTTAPVACAVSATTAFNDVVLVQSHSHSPSRALKALRPARVIEMYSAGVKLAVVARGEADLYANTYPNFKDWDICAGHILVTEAGGKVTMLNGNDIGFCAPDYSQRGGLLASNGRLHQEAVKRFGIAGIG